MWLKRDRTIVPDGFASGAKGPSRARHNHAQNGVTATKVERAESRPVQALEARSGDLFGGRIRGTEIR